MQISILNFYFKKGVPINRLLNNMEEVKDQEPEEKVVKE